MIAPPIRLLEQAHTCRLLGRPLRNLAREHAERTALLQHEVRTSGLDSAEAAALLDGIERSSHWLQRSLTEGREEALRRLESYDRFLRGLPLTVDEPIRAYCARVLDDSHALDDDRILRGAIERRLRARNPEADDVVEAYQREGLLARLNNGNVLLFGSIAWEAGGTRVDLSGFAEAGAAMSLTEEAIQRGRPAPPYPRLAVFVENPSSWQLLRHQPFIDTLCVLTDGIPNKATQHFAAHLDQAGVRLLHWGDIDAGGFLALNVLQKHARVTPRDSDPSEPARNGNPCANPATPSSCAPSNSEAGWSKKPSRSTR